MKKFEVEIVETLKRKVVIYAEDIDHAEEIVKDGYYDEEYVLDDEDFCDVEFNATELR